MAKSRALYQLKITLREIEPSIWRRVQVWEHTPLAQLPKILQIAMTWEDCHLHEFTIGRRLYGVPDPDDELYEREVLDDRRHRLCDVVPRVGTQFLYTYDFGDNWRHDLHLEAILIPEPAAHYPRCVDGARQTPPEDVGGIGGYERYLEAIADSEHERHEELLLWRGPFEPEAFSIEHINRRLHQKFRSTPKL